MIYLDNAASTPCLDCVMDAMCDVNNQWSNVHRGLHRYAEYTTERYEEARDRVAEFIGADREKIAFTSGTTDSLNMVANGLDIGKEDTVVVTQMDHHSNILPWLTLGCNVLYTPVIDGLLDLDGFMYLLQKYHPKVVAFPSVSNVFGTMNPVDEITQMAHKVGAIVVLDAAQGALTRVHDTSSMQIDYMAFSGHKLHGPTGVGVLYGRNLNRLRPSRYGGGMVAEIGPSGFTTKSAPQKLEAGTPPIQQAIGLGEACRYWDEIGRVKVRKQLWQLTAYAYQRLDTLPGVHILGPSIESRIGIISFTVDGIHAHDVAALCNKKGIAIRAGHHCALPLHRALGITASARISFSYFNTRDEIDSFIEAITEIKDSFAASNCVSTD